MGTYGQAARRRIEAEYFVMKSRGEMFTYKEFAHALHLPHASAFRYIHYLKEDGVIVQYDFGVYCMAIPYRNFIEGVADSLVPTVFKEVTPLLV